MKRSENRYKTFFIILNYNNHESASLVVEGLKKNVEVENAGILIVDNNSSDESFEKLSKKYKSTEDVFVIKNEVNSGYAAGNNFGVRYIIRKLDGCDYIAITNPDVFFYQNTNLQTTIDKLERDNSVAAISPIQLIKNSFSQENLASKIPTGYDDFFYYFSSLFRKFNKTPYKNYNLNSEKLSYVEVLPGSFFIIKMAIFEKVGFFDEKTFLYCEERILGKKLKDAGYKEAVDHEQFYIHDHGTKKKQDVRSFMRHYKISWKSKLYYNKNYNPEHSKGVVFWLKVLYPFKVAQVYLINGLRSFMK